MKKECCGNHGQNEKFWESEMGPGDFQGFLMIPEIMRTEVLWCWKVREALPTAIGSGIYFEALWRY